MPGKGMGRKSLAEVSKDPSLDVKEAQKRPSLSGVEMKEEESLHDEAKKNVSSMDLLKIILVENFKLP